MGHCNLRSHVLYSTPVDLNKIFATHEDLEAMKEAFKYKIVAVLRRRAPKYKNENSFGKAGSTTEELASFIMKLTTFFELFGNGAMTDRGVKFTKEERKLQQAALRNIHHAIISSCLTDYRDTFHLYFLEHDNSWNFTQKMCEDYDKRNKQEADTFHNNRSFHGRPEKQGRARARQGRVAAGASVSFA